MQRFFSPFLRADCISIPQEERGHKKVNKKARKSWKEERRTSNEWGGERMKKKGETRKVRTTFFLFHIRSSTRKHKKRNKGIHPAPVAAPDGRVEQTVIFDFGPEENGTRSTSSTRTRGKTKRKTKTATTAYAVNYDKISAAFICAQGQRGLGCRAGRAATPGLVFWIQLVFTFLSRWQRMVAGHKGRDDLD